MHASHHQLENLHPDTAPDSTAGGAQQRIPRLRDLLDIYRRRLSARIEACPGEFASIASTVLEDLKKYAPRSRPRRIGLLPFNQHVGSPLEWVRFPLRDNQVLWRFAEARLGKKALARHHKVPRTPSARPSRAVHTHPVVYDWPWQVEDFLRKGTRAQRWEATLAADFERAVASPLRRALRAARILTKYSEEMQPTHAIWVDLARAEAHLCEKLRVAPTPQSYVASALMPTILVHDEPASIQPEEPLARLTLLGLLAAPIEARIRACRIEYTCAAAILRERLQAGGAGPMQGPRLAPHVLVPRGAGAVPAIVWQFADAPFDPALGSSQSVRWKDVALTNAVDAARFRAYVAACNRRGSHSVSKHEYFWLTEAPHRLRDFVRAERWERAFALYYDQTIVAPLRRQWLLVHWWAYLEPYLLDPDECTLALDPQKYRPEAL
jgi:hypothetical protein